MSGLGTIRERVQRAATALRHQEGVVLTTFNLSAPFLEEQALPAILGVEARGAVARRAELHQRLGATPCVVFYDPSVAPQLSGEYRYVARPVPLRGRLFHPKLIIIAGRAADGSTRVYLAVSSANLSLSGWGRNAESFGETWISNRAQQSWGALDRLLAWLQGCAALGEAPGEADALVRVRAALGRMPASPRAEEDVSALWSVASAGRLYTSVVDTGGLFAFLGIGPERRPDEVRVYSPYWSDVAASVTATHAERVVLIPALRADGRGFGLTREQAASVRDAAQLQRAAGDAGDRFWHMKLYSVCFADGALCAVGSCNFTHAGLAGAAGNVEAMLVFEAERGLFAEGAPVREEELAQEPLAEEEAPAPAPIAIVVAFDWRAMCWRWWLDPAPGQRGFVLELVGVGRAPIVAGAGARAGSAPPRGASFKVSYQVADGERSWEGQVVELNLDHSARVYGAPLTAQDILESWRVGALAAGKGGAERAGEEAEAGEDAAREVAAAFDAVNLYALYEAMRALRGRLAERAAYPEQQRALLVGRPDSAMALALLADQDGEAPVVRYLVLRELCGVITAWGALLDEALVARVSAMADRARARTLAQLIGEVKDAARADEMLGWFEAQLAAMDGRQA